MVFWITLIWVLAVWQIGQSNLSKLKRCADGVDDIYVNKWFCVLIFAVPFIVATFRMDFGDTPAYIEKWRSMETGFENFDNVINPETKSKLYVGIEFIFRTLVSTDKQMWFGFIALIQSYCMLKTLRRYSSDLGFSVFLYVAMALFFSWMCNGSRQCLAVSICFLCTPLLLDNKWYLFYPILILVMGIGPIAGEFGWTNTIWFLGGIHQSTLIFILASFCIRGKPFNYKVWLVAFVFLVLLVTGGLDSFLEDSVENTTYTVDIDNARADTGTSVLRVFVESVPMVLALIAKDYINRKSTPDIIKLSANASVITSVLYIASAFTSGLYVGRLPIFTEMYNLILLPWLIRHPYKQNRDFVTIVAIVLYIAYFFYQVNIAWNGEFEIGYFNGYY